MARSTRSIELGSWIAASSRRAPPQFGHVKISTRNTHSTQLRPRVVAPHSTTQLAGTMRHPRYLHHRPRSNFVRPRLLQVRTVLVECSRFAILSNLRNDPMPQAGIWRQHPVIRHQVPPRSRHQSQQPLNQHLRRKHHVRRAIPPGLLQRIRNPPIRQSRQPTLRNRWPPGIPTQMLEPLAITGSYSHRSVQREAIQVRAQRRDHKRLVTCAAPNTNITLASAFAR